MSSLSICSFLLALNSFNWMNLINAIRFLADCSRQLRPNFMPATYPLPTTLRHHLSVLLSISLISGSCVISKLSRCSFLIASTSPHIPSCAKCRTLSSPVSFESIFARFEIAKTEPITQKPNRLILTESA